MDKWIAFIIALGCVIYSDPGSGNFIQAFVMPIVLGVCLIYMLTLTACMILSVAALSFYFSDLTSSSVFEGVLLPIFGVIWLFVFLYWAWETGRLGSSTSGSGDGGGLGGDSGGCDGGGGGGGE